MAVGGSIGKVLVIGLMGKKGSGKSSCAKVMEGYEFQPYALADPIREIIMAMFGWNYEQTANPVLKELVDPVFGVSPREMMQFIGTEFGQFLIGEHFPSFEKSIGRTIWVHGLKRLVDDIREDPLLDRVVVTDVRFPHEADYIHSVGGYVVQIVRPSMESIDTHLSETSVNEIDYDLTFINEAESVDELFQRFDAFMSENEEIFDGPF